MTKNPSSDPGPMILPRHPDGSPAPAPPLELLVARVRGEYTEMPGLRVSLTQACRLWQLDVSTCEMLLDLLVREGFLSKTKTGFYIAWRE